MRHETDPERFGWGVEALGRLGTAEALEALRELASIRLAEEFQSRVVDVLARADPEQAFAHHFAVLLEGSTHPAAANEAARQLARLVGSQHLEPLRVAVMHPDLLVSRHALKLIHGIPCPETAAFLLGLLAGTLEELRRDRRLRDGIQALRNLPPGELRTAVLERLQEVVADLSPRAQELLREGSGPAALAVLDPLKAFVEDPLEVLLLEVLRSLLDPKAGRTGALFGEAMEGVQQRVRRWTFVVDACAEGLVSMVQRGLLQVEEVVPLLVEGVREQMGREGIVRALGTLVSGDDESSLRVLLEQGDAALRTVALDTLGARRDPALRWVFTEACRDAIAEVSQRALLHLGALPDPEGQARTFLSGNTLEERYLGLRFVGLHRLTALGPELLAQVRHGEREEFVLAALRALVELGQCEMVAELLEALHSGQSPRLQEALAEAIRDLADPLAARALGERAQQLRQPLLHVIAVEALVQSHRRQGSRLTPDDAIELQAHVQEAWSARNPWALQMRTLEALKDAPGGDPAVWRGLVALVQETLAERRGGSGFGWSTDEVIHVQAILRELQKRC